MNHDMYECSSTIIRMRYPNGLAVGHPAMHLWNVNLTGSFQFFLQGNNIKKGTFPYLHRAWCIYLYIFGYIWLIFMVNDGTCRYNLTYMIPFYGIVWLFGWLLWFKSLRLPGRLYYLMLHGVISHKHLGKKKEPPRKKNTWAVPVLGVEGWHYHSITWEQVARSCLLMVIAVGSDTILLLVCIFQNLYVFASLACIFLQLEKGPLTFQKSRETIL